MNAIATSADPPARLSNEEIDGAAGRGPSAGTLGLVGGQVARLTFMHHVDGPGELTPCVAVARIRGVDGSVLVERRFEPPPPYQRVSIEFAYPPGGRGRLGVYGELEHTPGHRIGAIHKGYDAHTGAMVAAFLPRIVPSPELGAEPAATAP